MNAAFRQAKGTGDLFVNATYFVPGAGGRRQTTVTLDGANNDEAWGRQTMIATVPMGRNPGNVAADQFLLRRGRLDFGPAPNIVTKSGTTALHGEGLYLARPGTREKGKLSNCAGKRRFSLLPFPFSLAADILSASC